MEQNLDNIELWRKYEEKKPGYERLLHMVSLILNSAIDKKKIKIHSIKHRVKEYNSFLEKIERKNYSNPFKECTDLAGMRVLCLFVSQVEEIRKIIEEEFDVLEITDKKSSKKFDQFGYVSLHMLIKIPKSRLKLVECDGLENLVLEIQVRTILQEVWAEIEHYLNYKTTKEEKNEELLRKIYSLAGMFELADSSFQEIHEEFRKMMEQKLENKENITALNLFKFAKSYFKTEIEYDASFERKFHQLSGEIKKINIKSFEELKAILDKHNKSIELYSQKENSPATLVRIGLALEFGKKFDLVFGLKGYSEKIKKELRQYA